MLLKKQLSEAQQEVVGTMEEMDAEIHNLAKLVWPQYYKIDWLQVARLRIPHLQSALRQQFPDLACLSPGNDIGGDTFRRWLGHQVARFGEWLEVKPEE